MAAIAARDGQAAAWTEAFARFGVAAPLGVQGDFAVVVRDHAGRMFLAVDRFATHSLCYRVDGKLLHFGERADDVAGIPSGSIRKRYSIICTFTSSRRRELSSTAYIDYVKATMPSSTTDRSLSRRGGILFSRKPIMIRLTACATSSACYCGRQSLRRSAMSVSAVFFSGGTDSSTVTGMLGQISGEPPRTFSIGFEAKGFDEIEFARTTAQHFAADHHEYYVTPDDLVKCIPMIAASYDQPFGNSSVVPAYFCARMAREAGVERMLGGDGGDELFGGNSRYAVQRVFSFYDASSKVHAEISSGTRTAGWPLPGRIAGLKKAVRYVEQASTPMPDRMQSYNLLTRIGVDEALDDGFVATVDREEPLRQQRMVYEACSARSLINRMLAFDWKYTLADNDLPKVVGATSLAGVSVGFPLLDDNLVAFFAAALSLA